MNLKEIGFDALVKHAQCKVKERQHLIQATQFRYVRLFLKSFAAVSSSRRADLLRLKFKRWMTSYLYQRALVAHHREYEDRHNKRLLSVAFMELRRIALLRQKLHLASEFYRYKVFQLWANEIRLLKAQRIDIALKKFKLEQRTNYLIKQRTFKMIVKTFNKEQISKQLLNDVSEYLSEKVAERSKRKAFTDLRINMLVNQQLKRRKQKLQKFFIMGLKSNMSHLSRLMLNSRQHHKLSLLRKPFQIFKKNYDNYMIKLRKASAFHSKNLKKQYFRFLFSTRFFKILLANNQFMSRIFTGWTQYLKILKERLPTLELLGRQLTAQHLINLKKQHFQAFVIHFKEKQVRKQLYSNLSEYIKFKSQERFKRRVIASLSNNRKINFHKRKIIDRHKRIIFNSLLDQVTHKHVKAQAIQTFYHKKTLSRMHRAFVSFKRMFIRHRNLCQIADSQYQGKLLRFILLAWIDTVVQNYQKQTIYAIKFYNTRRLVFIFSALRDHAVLRIERKIKIDEASEQIHFREQRMMQSVFRSLRSFTARQKMRRNYQQELLQKGFYSWRLFLKLKKYRK